MSDAALKLQYSKLTVSSTDANGKILDLGKYVLSNQLC